MDERLFEARPIEPGSIGDYVLSGGEVAALVTLDACVRLLPGGMGATSSGEEESFEAGLRENPQYTRPVLWDGRATPAVLRSGDHAKNAAWRKQRADHGPEEPLAGTEGSSTVETRWSATPIKK